MKPEYRAWLNMKQRCTNPKISTFKYYGGRGIKICKRWNSFVNFLADMGNKPSIKYTLERKNTNGNYTPENCIWETQTKQARNKRINHLETYKGETKTMIEWSEIFNLLYSTLIARLNILHWNINRALTEKVN